MEWEDCLKTRTAKEKSSDINLIQSLKESSKNKSESEKLLPLTNITSSTKISLSYDSLRELLDSLSISKGYKIYNHECFSAFLKEICKDSDSASKFYSIRQIRNKINYYGEKIPLEDTKIILEEISLLKKQIMTLFNHSSK